MTTLIRFVSCRKVKTCRVALACCAVVTCLLPACASRSEFQKGYDLGASNTVKRQYWILQNMQKTSQQDASPHRLTNYRLTIQPDPKATVKTVPYDIVLPVYE